ncbi:hypothetical protein P8452_14747 [Trifolium repens]|nr:hypothetical protein P8452_14747 [Trifolium repens]
MSMNEQFEETMYYSDGSCEVELEDTCEYNNSQEDPEHINEDGDESEDGDDSSEENFSEQSKIGDDNCGDYVDSCEEEEIVIDDLDDILKIDMKNIVRFDVSSPQEQCC